MITRRYVLRCRDPETYRSAHRLVSPAFVSINDPTMIGNLLIALSTNIMRSWSNTYGARFPYDRVEWDVTTTEVASL